MLVHGVPWQAALAGALLLIVLFILFLVSGIVVSYFGLSYIILSILIVASFIIFINLIPLFLNLSRGFFNILFVLLIFQIVCTILAFAFQYMASGILAATGEVNNSLRDCVYFSITTFTTLGYGDFRPQPHMRLATSIEALFGMVSMALGVSLIWLWCREHLIPKDKALFDGNRRHKKSLEIHRMRIRTITGRERKLKDYVLPPKPGTSFRWDVEREEWVEISESDVMNKGDLVLESLDDRGNKK